MKRLFSIFAAIILMLSMLVIATSCADDGESGQNGTVPEEGINTPWLDYE
jgi:hypothetical protein